MSVYILRNGWLFVRTCSAGFSGCHMCVCVCVCVYVYVTYMSIYIHTHMLGRLQRLSGCEIELCLLEGEEEEHYWRMQAQAYTSSLRPLYK